MDLQKRMALFRQTDLYLVITEAFCAGGGALDVLARALEAGVGIVQLREQELDDRRLYERGLAFREQTQAAGALLIVDDRLDIALAVNADGVHLGQKDLPVAAARRMAPELIIGASSHSLDQALAAEKAGADYVNVGPIYPTETKAVPTGAVGPHLIADVAPRLTVPFTVMGGITIDNIGEVLRQGARHIAVVTAVTAAPDVRAAAQALRTKIADNRLPG